MMKRRGYGLLLMVLCACGAAAGGAPAGGEVAVGQRLRNATLQGLNGPSIPLARLLGRPLLINVWASWCEPCRGEMASLERLAWSPQRGGFSIIGISTDDDPQQPLALLQSTHATISQYLDGHLEMETMLGASRLPLTVLVGADGTVLQRIYGARQWDSPQSLQLLEQVLQAGGPH